LVTLNAKNGEVIAMVGGYNFYTNRFNNATQAFRQTGSCFKPFIYAAAIEWGLTPDSIVSGAPISRGSWQPHNYDGSLGGPDVPMRLAIAKSLNIQAVHLLDLVGIQTASQMVRRFGITVPMAPYLPSALGATEVPLIQMVSAYSAFPNKGVRYAPHLVRRVVDQEGNTLDEWEKETYKVFNEYVALTMVSMMRGVVQFGTAGAANSLGVPLAAKTGTVNDHTDVWFIGYTPTFVTGVWMGFPDRKRPLGGDMTGAHGALPIFVDYMKDFLKNKPKEDFPQSPSMPLDMRELLRLRQNELAAARMKAAEEATANGFDLSSTTSTDSDLEQLTLPPPPESLQNESSPGESKVPQFNIEPRESENKEVLVPKTESKSASTINSAPATGLSRPRVVQPVSPSPPQLKRIDEKKKSPKLKTP
ncbi:MAG: penicillin-binding transpeptidase domain-containing protein, partial [Pyrinomonadaceae bacterium]